MGALLSLNSQITKRRFGLGYKPTHEELFQASRGKKRKCAASGMFNPHIKTTFLALAEIILPKHYMELEDDEPNLAYIIQLCPEEFSVNAITSFEDNSTSIIRPGILGETTNLWTIKPCFVVAPVK